MPYDWILDVLTDLRAFAGANGLTALAEQLDDTRHLAVAEIAQFSGANGGRAEIHAQAAGSLHRHLAAGDDA